MGQSWAHGLKFDPETVSPCKKCCRAGVPHLSAAFCSCLSEVTGLLPLFLLIWAVSYSVWLMRVSTLMPAFTTVSTAGKAGARLPRLSFGNLPWNRQARHTATHLWRRVLYCLQVCTCLHPQALHSCHPVLYCPDIGQTTPNL